MTADEVGRIFFAELGNSAPEWDPAEIAPQDDIREADHTRLLTIDGAVATLPAKNG